jgi:hypothetical protein
MGRVLVGLVGAATAAALIMPGAAFAKGPGGGGEEVAANNLSVPAVFVGTGGLPTGVVCDGETLGLALPEDITTNLDPSTGFEVAGYYYVQGVHKWQAQCITATKATAVAEWGDNLAGDAKLKVGSPIRVEVGLVATSALKADGTGLPEVMTGWNVIKLEPSKLDRESKYGTLATELFDELGVHTGWASSPQDLTTSTRVKDAAARLAISGTEIADGIAIAPEINATGRVVYGYNLRVATAGTYVITFTFPNVDITAADAGVIAYEPDPLNEGQLLPYGHSVSLSITVGGGGGGGGGRPTR